MIPIHKLSTLLCVEVKILLLIHLLLIISEYVNSMSCNHIPVHHEGKVIERFTPHIFNKNLIYYRSCMSVLNHI